MINVKFLGLLLLLVIAIVIQRYLKKRKLAKYKGEYVEAFPYDRPPLAYAYLKTYRFTRLDHLIHYFILKWISERRIHPRTYKGGIFKKRDRKSTRLNSSHVAISYAVFCLKKKKNNIQHV